MRVVLRTSLTLSLGAAFLVALNLLPRSADARGACGRGCQRSMGSCSVNASLWEAAMNARQSGHTLTSCCRTPEYNRQMASCGYPVAANSAHTQGRAVDVLVPPGQCNGRSLSAYGFSNVCPLYHFQHCHVALCGDARSYDRAKSRARSHASGIRAKHMRTAFSIGAHGRHYHHNHRSRVSR